MIFVLVAASSCGVDNGPYYDSSKKTFGLGVGGQETPKTDPEIVDPKDDPLEENITISPDQLIFKSTFEGHIDPLSMKLIYGEEHGQEIEPKTSSFYEDKNFWVYKHVGIKHTVNRLLDMKIELTAEQNYGDGKHAQYSQHLVSSVKEVNSDSLFKETFDSGTLVYDRKLNPKNCPKQFTCIDRIRLYSNEERSEGATYCFKDRDNQLTSFPLGASPGVSRKDLLNLDTSHGPYKMIKYSAADVECSKTHLTPSRLLELEVRATIEEEPERLKKLAEDNKTPRIDFGIKIEYFRLVDSIVIDPNTVPYLDTLANLQAKTIYYFNAVTKDLVLISKTARRELKDPTMGYYGALVDINFKLCKDLLIEGSKNHCE